MGAAKTPKPSTPSNAKTPAKKKTADAAPWDRENPKGDRHQHLSAAAKATAKRRAKKAGRPYPNLVDNMRAAREEKK